MTRENAADKAHRYLTENRLTVLKVCGAQVLATCRGDGATYTLSVDERRPGTAPVRAQDAARTSSHSVPSSQWG